MKPIKRKYKPTIVCDKCHKSIGKTKPSYKKVGEIEYRYWRCRHCSTVYVISATDTVVSCRILTVTDLGRALTPCLRKTVWWKRKKR